MLLSPSHLPLLFCIELCPALAQLGVHVCIVSLIIRVYHLIIEIMVPGVALRVGIADKGWVFLSFINFPPACQAICLLGLSSCLPVIL